MPRKRSKSAPANTAPKRKADRGPGKRLTFADRYRLLELHRAHPEWSFLTLATEAGVSPETARLTCHAAGKSAVDLMAAYAAPMLTQWIKASRAAGSRGDHRPARDWLLHAGAIDPLPETQRGTGPAVVIVNAPMPGMPGYQQISLDSSTFPVRRQTSIEVENGAARRTADPTKE